MRKNQHAMECQTSFKSYEWPSHAGISANMYSSKTVVLICNLEHINPKILYFFYLTWWVLLPFQKLHKKTHYSTEPQMHFLKKKQKHISTLTFIFNSHFRSLSQKLFCCQAKRQSFKCRLNCNWPIADA